MKRYLIESAFAVPDEPTMETTPGNGTPTPSRKLIYQILDTRTKQHVPPEGTDIALMARTCAQLNEADEQAEQASPRADAPLESGAGDTLPDDIVQSIAISNAKSIGAQPAILANLALAQQVFNQNMQQQISLGQQQAMNLVRLAVVAKCVAIIDGADGNSQAMIEKLGIDIEKLFQDMGRGLDTKAHPAPQAP